MNTNYSKLDLTALIEQSKSGSKDFPKSDGYYRPWIYSLSLLWSLD